MKYEDNMLIEDFAEKTKNENSKSVDSDTLIEELWIKKQRLQCLA